MRIAVDAMGGDHGPRVIVPGALRALERLGSDVELVLFGNDDGRKAGGSRRWASLRRLLSLFIHLEPARIYDSFTTASERSIFALVRVRSPEPLRRPRTPVFWAFLACQGRISPFTMN